MHKSTNEVVKDVKTTYRKLFTSFQNNSMKSNADKISTFA